jgi:hypothetical protein
VQAADMTQVVSHMCMHQKQTHTAAEAVLVEDACECCTSNLVAAAQLCLQGINTVVINVTVLQGTAVISNGVNSAPAPRRDESFASPPIDFFFFMNGNETHDSRPKADVTVSSCQPESECYDSTLVGAADIAAAEELLAVAKTI